MLIIHFELKRISLALLVTRSYAEMIPSEGEKNEDNYEIS